MAEGVVRGSVARQQLADLSPVARAVVLKDVRRAGVAAGVIVLVCPDDNGVAADADGPAEVVARRAVGCQQLVRLRPCRLAALAGKNRRR